MKKSSEGIKKYAKEHKNLGLDNPFPYLKDSDRDGFPNTLDCAPRNPKKQAFVTHAVGGFLRKREGVIGRVAKAYGEYRKGAPEREEKKIQALDRQRRLLEKKAAIARQRTQLRKARIERIGTTTKQAYAPMLGLFGTQTPVTKPIVRVKRKRRKKKR